MKIFRSNLLRFEIRMNIDLSEKSEREWRTFLVLMCVECWSPAFLEEYMSETASFYGISKVLHWRIWCKMFYVLVYTGSETSNFICLLFLHESSRTYLKRIYVALLNLHTTRVAQKFFFAIFVVAYLGRIFLYSSWEI